MNKIFSKTFLTIISLFILNLVGFFSFAAPSIDSFKNDLNVYQVDSGVTADNSLEDNIRELFSPGNSTGTLWVVLRNIGVGFLVIFLIRTGFMFMSSNGDEGSIKKARMNLLYIAYGAFLYFGAMGILDLINFDSLTSKNVVSNLQTGAFFQILLFFKVLIFFLAIIQIMYYGFKIIRAFEKEDKIKSGRKGILNVIIALILIKVIDYLYFVAADTQDFKSNITGIITTASRLLGYVLGSLIIIMVLYGGLQMVLSRGEDDTWKKVMTIFKTIFLVVLILMLFLLISHQVITEYAS
ncbi:MAG: hypothetical protein V3575_05080 [Candidatus Absconditabacteria bacterium]